MLQRLCEYGNGAQMALTPDAAGELAHGVVSDAHNTGKRELEDISPPPPGPPGPFAASA
jgi:hypothetical protein